MRDKCLKLKVRLEEIRDRVAELRDDPRANPDGSAGRQEIRSEIDMAHSDLDGCLRRLRSMVTLIDGGF